MMKQSSKSQSRAGSIGICVALALFVLIGLGYLMSLGSPQSEAAVPPVTAPASTDGKTNAPPEMPVPLEMDYSTHPKEAMERMRRAVRESGGDYNRISAHDKHMFDSLTGGFGKAWFEELAQNPQKYQGL